jgi:hypothetical protein
MVARIAPVDYDDFDFEHEFRYFHSGGGLLGVGRQLECQGLPSRACG